MIKLTPTINANTTYKYPTSTAQNQTFYGISILAPLPNDCLFSFINDPISYPIETVQGIHCPDGFSGFIISNTGSDITLSIYLQTQPSELLPQSYEIQTQVNVSANPATTYEYNSGTTSSSTMSFLSLPSTPNELDLIITGGLALIQFMTLNGFGPVITLPSGYYAFSLASKSIQYGSSDNTSTITVQMIGLK